MTAGAHRVGLTLHGANPFDQRLRAHGGGLVGRSIRTVQVNIGLRCNLACRHCHVESSPTRAEEMSRETMHDVLRAYERCGAETIDITGGAPEMHPSFRDFVGWARACGARVMVRTNLTIMLEEGYEDLPEFFRKHDVHVIASLPCYLEENVRRQRGLHVYHESVEVLRRLNAVGYGQSNALPLDLVYNPVGPSLPPPQARLEVDYRRVLDEQFAITFTRLIAITNLPIGRFAHDLDRDGRGDPYRQLLRDSFNPGTLDDLMCRHQLHVAHDGTVYDCDFNYAIGLCAQSDDRSRMHVRDVDPAVWAQRRIATGEHCFGCTAGCGSSCGGALVKQPG